MLKKLLYLTFLFLFSFQLLSQTNSNSFILNKITTSYPEYTFTNSTSTPLLIVDGKITNTLAVSSVDYNTFGKLTFIDKNSPSINKYGNNAINGVFIIETKNYLAKKWLDNIINFDDTHRINQLIHSKRFNYKRLMIIHNGCELQTDFFNEPEINSTHISSISLKRFDGIVGGVLVIKSNSSKTK